MMRPFCLALTSLTVAGAFVLGIDGCSTSDSGANGARDAAPANDANGDTAAVDAASDVRQEDGALCPNQRVEQGDAGAIVVCDEGYAVPPYLHVPAVRTLEDGNREMVGAIEASDFRDGEGHTFQLPDDMAKAETWTNSSHEYQADHLYRATVSADGNVTKLVRFAKVADALFFRGWEGRVFEGKIAKRALSGDTYETTPSAPIRLRITEVRDGLPPGWKDYEHGVFLPLAPYKPVHAVGVVENLDHGVTSAAGTCLAPLSALGAENPNIGATIRFVRVPSMHSPLSNTVVITFETASTVPTNMAHTLWVGPAELISASPKVQNSFNAPPHGAPQYGITLTASAVTGGGAACTP